jgi:hypothetical protein
MASGLPRRQIAITRAWLRAVRSSTRFKVICCSENFDTFMALLSSPSPGDYGKSSLWTVQFAEKQVNLLRHKQIWHSPCAGENIQ